MKSSELRTFLHALNGKPGALTRLKRSRTIDTLELRDVLVAHHEEAGAPKIDVSALTRNIRLKLNVGKTKLVSDLAKAPVIKVARFKGAPQIEVTAFPKVVIPRFAGRTVRVAGEISLANVARELLAGNHILLGSPRAERKTCIARGPDGNFASAECSADPADRRRCFESLQRGGR